MFPLTRAPHVGDKFPFRNTYLYTSGEHHVKPNEISFGQTAQQSLTHLEATGRKPNLQRVPWFRSTWRRR